MLKAVLLASCFIIGLPAAAAAQTAMPGSESPVSVTIGAASSYVIEDLGFQVDGPVANIGIDYDFGNGWTGNVWGQFGEKDLSKEIDGSLTWLKEFSNGASASVTPAIFLYPSGGSDTIYALSGEVSVPTGPVAIDFVVDRYMGGYENTVVSIAATSTVGQVELSFGKTVLDGAGAKPWFARVSIPIGPERLGLRAGVRGFAGKHGDGAVFELTRSF